MRRREFIAGLGSAAAWPLVARAQQPAVPVIGYLSGATEYANRQLNVAFRQGLGEQGYVEGRNIEILFRYADTRYDLLPALAGDLVRRRVAAIVVMPNIAFVQIAKNVTTTIPIVFAISGDPVQAGLVTSLNRPGGNTTGTFYLAVPLIAKRLEVLHQIVPTATSIGYLVNPINAQLEVEAREAETAARSLGLRLAVVKASTPAELELAFTTLVGQRIAALLTGADSLFYARRDELVALAARYAVPTVYYGREFVDGGGLISYGASLSDAFRLAGTYAGRILNGEKPSDLPVQQSTKVELIINMKTAKALGITFPLSLLGRADEVIE